LSGFTKVVGVYQEMNEKSLPAQQERPDIRVNLKIIPFFCGLDSFDVVAKVNSHKIEQG